mgnify:CR=1 FL=1
MAGNPQEGDLSLSRFFSDVEDASTLRTPPLDPNDFRFGKYSAASLANEVYLIPRNGEIQKCKLMYKIKQISNNKTHWYVMYSLSGEIFLRDFLEQHNSTFDRIQSRHLDELFAIVQASRKRVANNIIRAIIDRLTALDHLYHARVIIGDILKEHT